ncbi:ATP-binding cassette domain-containing protein [Heliobacterium gestii]|uniref:ATP-binding cassette domain-containing protein n=1 Tax=Heliomicrobium gestii TaxID=2699 RepID=A0A845LG18_HELGE|nr:ABC transporter ATP-binding protein [Heliomicrobium gestii]MBM7867542.1 NitT/TauT family transport system ATP-binding protein [Heliomicrobium gestii]MZP43910.1 ATP-binding cassette domain-containing protein [Heliomicrobium gestii]
MAYRQPGNNVTILDDFDLTVPEGERCVLIGPSGCGKSTLLLLLAGLLRPSGGRNDNGDRGDTASSNKASSNTGDRSNAGDPSDTGGRHGGGRLDVGGRPLAGPRPQTSLILQDFGLFPWKTVEENIALGLRIKGLGGREAVEQVRPVIERLGLAGTERRYPRQLSGGQRQRVAVGRALATQPDLLLMDEPFSSLDALTRESLQDLILEIAGRDGLTIVLVTHSIEEAAFLGQRILILDGPPLRIIGQVENSGAGAPDYRRQKGFHAACDEIRRLMVTASERREGR